MNMVDSLWACVKWVYRTPQFVAVLTAKGMMFARGF